MREIKFRGWDIEKKQWVYGYYAVHKRPSVAIGENPYKDKFLIIHSGFADWNMDRPLLATEVDPKSVGEWTGLTTPDGIDVYEGDILGEYTFTSWQCYTERSACRGGGR